MKQSLTTAMIFDMFFDPQASNMNPKIEELLLGISKMEGELEVQMALARAELKVRIEDGKVEFEKAVLQRHRELQTRLMATSSARDR